MKKRFIFPSLLLGTLLALPGAAFADTYNVTTIEYDGDSVDNIQQVIGADLRVSDGTLETRDVFLSQGTAIEPMEVINDFAKLGNVYDIGAIKVENVTASGSIFGIVTDDYKGRFNLGTIELGSSAEAGDHGSLIAGSITGFYALAEAETSTHFEGSINAESITVNNEGTGMARGLQLFTSGSPAPSQGIASGANIYVKNLSVIGQEAIGIDVGEIATGGELRLDSVNIESKTYASAVHVVGDNGGTGKIIVGKGTITGTTDVAAVTFNDSNETRYDSNAQVELGALGDIEVSVTGSDTNSLAVGVKGDNVKNVILKGNLKVTNEAVSTNAYGVLAGTADVIIDGNVNIVAEGGAFVTRSETVGGETITGGDLNLTLTEGSVLDTTASGGVDSKGAFAITGGTFNSGVVNAASYTGNNTIINISDADLAASVIEEEDENGNQIYNLNNTKVKILSDAKITADDITGITVNATGNSAVIVNKTQEVVFDANGDVSLKMAEAPIAGGYVNAMRMHHNYTTWNAVGSHLLSNIGAPTSGGNYRGQECDPCDPIGACDPCGSLGSTVARTAWVNYVARSNEYGDLFGGTWDFDSEGVQFGTDLYRTKRGQLGVLFGYEDGRMRNSLFGDRMENENYYIGLYGSRIFRNGWDVRGSFSYGWQDYNMNRFDNVGTVTYQYASAFDGNTTEATVEIGKRFFRGNWSLRPVLGVDVFTNETDAAQETVVGTTSGGSAATYLENSLTQAFIRTGADLTWQRKRLAFNAGLFYSYDMHGEDLVTAIDIEGAERGQLTGTALGRELLSWNVGTKVAVAKNLDIFGGYRGESILDDGDGDGINNTGYIGAAWRW